MLEVHDGFEGTICMHGWHPSFRTSSEEHNLLLKTAFTKVVGSGITTRPNAKLVKYLSIPVAMSTTVQASVPILWKECWRCTTVCQVGKPVGKPVRSLHNKFGRVIITTFQIASQTANKVLGLCTTASVRQHQESAKLYTQLHVYA